MGVESFSLPRELVEFLAAEYKLASFYETGTCYGASSAWAALRFAQVVTVERHPQLHALARMKLLPYRNARLELGDSRDTLRQDLPGLPPTLFWLDAHWMGV